MLAPMYSIPMCTLECSHLGFVLCLYEEPLLDLIESIHGFGWWFLRWGILEYKQWIRPSLTSTFCSRRFLLLLGLLLLLCIGWDSQLQQFNLCLIFYFSRQFTFELRKKKRKKKKKKYRAAKHAPDVDPNSSLSCKNLTRHCLCPITASTGNVLCRHLRI